MFTSIERAQAASKAYQAQKGTQSKGLPKKIDQVAKGVIGKKTETTSARADQLEWITSRENRYLEAIKGLSSFTVYQTNVRVLKEAVENKSLKTALNIILEVSNGDLSSDEVRKSYYHRFLESLRNAVSELEDDSFDAKVARQLCTAVFTVDIKDTEVGVAFINKLLGDYNPGCIQDLESVQLELSLRKGLVGKNMKHKVTDTRRKLSANNPTGEWDPASYSIRSKIADVQVGGREVTFIRTACPVIGFNNAPEIDPIFIGMLRDMKAQKKQYLYINNQSADMASDKRSLQNFCESSRVDALRALSETDEFKGMFHVISFAHDSEFYTHPSSVKARDLKEDFTTHLLKSEQGYVLPSSFFEKGSLDEITKTLDFVHRKFFDAKEKLTAQERQEFLHIAYAALSELFIDKLKVNAVNITCKDGVDRAAGSVANLFKYTNSNVDFQLLKWALSFPAVLNHARPPKGHRHEISISSLKRIDSKQS